MHKPMCLIPNVLVIVGGLNWGLVGLGGFLGKNLNLVNALVGRWPTVEWIVYLLVGLSAVGMAVMYVTSCKDCACQVKGK